MNEYLATLGIGVHLLKAKAIHKRTKIIPSVHAINLEPFKTSRLRVKRLIREPTIFPQNRAERRDVIMEEEKKEEEKDQQT